MTERARHQAGLTAFGDHGRHRWTLVRLPIGCEEEIFLFIRRKRYPRPGACNRVTRSTAGSGDAAGGGHRIGPCSRRAFGQVRGRWSATRQCKQQDDNPSVGHAPQQGSSPPCDKETSTCCKVWRHCRCAGKIPSRAARRERRRNSCRPLTPPGERTALRQTNANMPQAGRIHALDLRFIAVGCHFTARRVTTVRRTHATESSRRR